jgi:Transcription factor involved in chromatin remodeling, contains bromodomain
VTDEADMWRVNYLIYRPMDLRTMETKASKNKYHSLQEFRADAETIVHNVVIYHGGRPCALFVFTSPSHVKRTRGGFSF